MLDLPKYIANICLAKRKSLTLCNKPFYRPRFLAKQTVPGLVNRCPSKFARRGHIASTYLLTPCLGLNTSVINSEANNTA